MVKLFKQLVFKAYVIFLMAFTVWYGTFMYPLIFGFEGKEEAEASLKDLGQAGTEEERLFVNLIASKGETKKTDLGYRVIEQPYIAGRFHHIGFEIEEDKASTCVSCHGNVPHNKSKEVRSFLNMHAFYTACQTCHIRAESDMQRLAFRWSEKESGQQVVNPRALVEIEDMYAIGDESYYPTYGDYGAKIAPGEVKENTFIFLKGSDEKAKAVMDRYIAQEKTLTTQQKSQMNEFLHKRITKEPIMCDECHNRTEPYIPFAELGYPPRRVAELADSSVVGMIEKYKEFFIPDFIAPVEESVEVPVEE
ncbi:MAG: hypothetical protein ABFS39_14365 [Pseudomonadota bacterium]